MTITIPASIVDATTTLNGLESLLTAKEWERAAIVATFVTLEDRHGGARSSATSSTCSDCSAGRDHGIVTFAAHGINGFKSKDTVRRYVQEWLNQRTRPLPGDVIDLDGLPEWPTRYGEGKEKHGAARSPGQVAAAMADNELTVKVIRQMDPDTRRKVVHALTDSGAVADAIADTPEIAAIIAASPAASVAVSRERNIIADQAGARDPRALERERERRRLADGPTILEVMELSLHADRLADVAGKFLTPEGGPGRYHDNARIQIEAALARIRAAAQQIDDVMNGALDTRVPDDISGII